MVDLTQEEKDIIADIINGSLDSMPMTAQNDAEPLTTILRKIGRIEDADEWAIIFGLP